jgi:hypothetical protein
LALAFIEELADRLVNRSRSHVRPRVIREMEKLDAAAGRPWSPLSCKVWSERMRTSA